MKIKDNMRFYQLIRNFLTEYLLVRRNFSPQTARAYKQALNLYRHYFTEVKEMRFENMDFDCFSRDNVYDFLIWLREERGCSPQTLNLRLAAMKSFLHYCGEEDVELMPLYISVAGIHAFKTQTTQCVKYLTKSQLKILFQMQDTRTKKGRRDRFFLIFAYETGARAEELLNLKLDDIAKANHPVTIRVCGKGRKVRHVPLEPTTVKHLDTYLREFHPQSRTDDFLFYTLHDGKHTKMTTGTVDYMVKKYAATARNKDASFPKNLHIHMLRHSIAMAMLKNGVPLPYIRDFLGHSSIDTTSIYSHADTAMIAEALASIEHEQTTDTKPSACKWKGKEEDLLRYCGML